MRFRRIGSSLRHLFQPFTCQAAAGGAPAGHAPTLGAYMAYRGGNLKVLRCKPRVILECGCCTMQLALTLPIAFCKLSLDMNGLLCIPANKPVHGFCKKRLMVRSVIW
jgi:hypothetical protein